jgi:Fe-S-cluster containining protein
LFADVELSSIREMLGLEALGLEVEESEGRSGGLLIQPCLAWQRKRCSIYPYRPDCCRTFECRLLRKVKKGSISPGQARQQVAAVLKHIKSMERRIAALHPGDQCRPLKERYLDALASWAEESPSAETLLKIRRLRNAMTQLENSIQKTFLQDS